MAKILVAGDGLAWQLAGVRDPTNLTSVAAAIGGNTPTRVGLAARGYDVINGADPPTGPAREDINYPDTWADTHRMRGLKTLFSPTKIVISFVGSTDVWNQWHTGPEERLTGRWQFLTIAGFQDIIAEAREGFTDSNIVVLKGWRIGPSAAGHLWDWSAIWFGQFLIDHLQADYPNLKWVDVSDIQGYDTRWRTPDHIMLTDAGVEEVADRVAVALVDAPTLSSVLPPLPATPHFEVSDRFKVAVSESHQVVNKLQVRRLDTPDVLAELPVADGTLTVSAQDATHRSLDVTVITDMDGTPIEPGSDLLSPFFCELQLWSGVKYPNGVEELISCGVFRLTDYETKSDERGLVHKLGCYDRSIRSRGKLGSAIVTLAGTKVEDAAARLIRLQHPTAVIKFPTTGFTTPALVHPESATAWGEARKLFESSGYVLSVNRDGVYVADPTVTDVTVPPDWEMVENARDVAWNVDRKSKTVANHVIVTAGGTGNQAIRGEAFDNDPNSPTYVKGPYGDVIEEITDERVTSTEQANRAAARELVRVNAGNETNTADCLPNPALNIDDTVYVYRTNGLNKLLLVDEYILPLVADQNMSVTFRAGLTTQFETSAAFFYVGRAVAAGKAVARGGAIGAVGPRGFGFAVAYGTAAGTVT